MTSTIIDRLDGYTGNVATKAPCRAASLGNIALYGLQTIDGIALAERDRVLVKNQTDGRENGIYNATSGDWVRAPDFDGALDVVGGTAIAITDGTLYAATYWRVSGDGERIPGADVITFERAIINNSGELVFRQSGTGAVDRPIAEKLRDYDVSVFDFLDDDDIADVQAYTFSRDLTSKVQTALDRAFASKRGLYAPAGGYYVPGGLTLPGESAKRSWSFRFYGEGPGELFAVVQNPNGSSIFKNDTNAPTLQYVQDAPNTGSGYSEIDHLVFFGNSTTPVVKLGALYSQSEFHHNGIYQAGNGDGLEVAQSNTSVVHHNYVINKDWNTGSLGSSRVGTGIYVHQPLSTGLTDVHSNTSRGFKDGFIFGDGSSNVLYSLRVSHNECSLTYNGITLTTSVSAAWVNNNYLEGIDGGVGILNEGRYNSIVSNLIFFGCSTAIKDTGALAIGTNIIGNLLAAGSRANTVLIDVASDAAYGGPVKIVRGNTLTFSGSGGSIAGVVGIQISGNTPRIYFEGNAFDPRGQWTGGAGTTAINDLSTASLAGVAQHGLAGFGVVKNGNQEFPKMSQGALGLGVPENALGDSAFSAGVLTTGLGSYFVLTLTAAQNITSIATAGGKTNQGDIIIIRATNANPTFKHGNNIKLSGSADFTPGANGAVIGFISESTFGGIPIARELFRTSY